MTFKTGDRVKIVGTRMAKSLRNQWGTVCDDFDESIHIYVRVLLDLDYILNSESDARHIPPKELITEDVLESPLWKALE